MNRSLTLRRLAYSAMALALCLVLPFLTGQIPQIGKMLLPMHLPVLLCGFLCSWQWGLAVGFLAPLLRSALFHMPVFYPMALCMAFEMAAYGALCGWLYRRLPRRKSSLYLALIGAMSAAAWSGARRASSARGCSPPPSASPPSGPEPSPAPCPGIILQLVLVPVLVMALEKAHLSARE